MSLRTRFDPKRARKETRMGNLWTENQGLKEQIKQIAMLLAERNKLVGEVLAHRCPACGMHCWAPRRT